MKRLSSYGINPSAKSLTILQELAKANKNAVEKCVDTYGSLIWTMAKEYADSTEEAEIAAQEIFLDIWRCAERFDPTKSDEAAFICLIARRLLIERQKDKGEGQK